MSIIRGPRPDSNFYMLDKRISEDKRLGWAARGLLIYLLGKPDHWKVSVPALIAETGGAVAKTGRDGLYNLLGELKAAGYAAHETIRDASGKVVGCDWQISEDGRDPSDQPGTAQPHPAQPDTVKPDALVSTDSPARIESSKSPVAPENIRCASWMLPSKPAPAPDLLGEPADRKPAAEKKPTKRAANAALDVAGLVETWNRIVGPTLGKVTRLSEPRRQMLLKRMNDEMENDPAQWEMFCRRVVASRFLTGVKTDFKADFDWCLSAKYSVRILEGIYNRDPEDQVENRGRPRRFDPSPGTI